MFHYLLISLIHSPTILGKTDEMAPRGTDYYRANNNFREGQGTLRPRARQEALWPAARAQNWNSWLEVQSHLLHSASPFGLPAGHTWVALKLCLGLEGDGMGLEARLPRGLSSPPPPAHRVPSDRLRKLSKPQASG